MDGEWGDWIALWGLINLPQLVPVAIVSSLGETELKDVYPADCQMKRKLLEIWHYLASQNPQLATAEKLKQKYDEEKITEEICPKCGRKFECYSQGIFESGGVL